MDTHGGYDDLDIDVPSSSDLDSLFEDPVEDTEATDTGMSREDPTSTSDCKPARLIGPPIPGLYFRPDVLLPLKLVEVVMQKCIATYFQANNVNQVMLFERADRLGHAQSLELTGLNSTLPSFLTDLLSTLSTSLRPVLSSKTHALLFPSPSGTAFARQVIINHYLPGEGITPHVDLLDRFGDGIIGVSMGSGCVMRFRKVEYDDDLDLDDDHHGDAQKQKEWDVYLPSGSVYVMTEEARYEWTHEIEKRMEDWVEAGLDPDDTSSEGGSAGVGKRIPRSVRVSITFRWLLPGADVVGTSDA